MRQSQKNEEPFVILLGNEDEDGQTLKIRNTKFKLDKKSTYSLFVTGSDVNKYKEG